MQMLRGDLCHILLSLFSYEDPKLSRFENSKMHENDGRPVVFIIEDTSPICSSLHALLQATDHQTQKLCDAGCFFREVVESGILRKKDIVLMDMDSNPNENFQVANVMTKSEDCPALIFLSGKSGVFKKTDSFVHPRLNILYKPVTAENLLARLEAFA